MRSCFWCEYRRFHADLFKYLNLSLPYCVDVYQQRIAISISLILNWHLQFSPFPVQLRPCIKVHTWYIFLSLLFEHYMYWPNWTSSSAQVIEETAVTLSYCYTLYFEEAKYLLNIFNRCSFNFDIWIIFKLL